MRDIRFDARLESQSNSRHCWSLFNSLRVWLAATAMVTGAALQLAEGQDPTRTPAAFKAFGKQATQRALAIAAEHNLRPTQSMVSAMALSDMDEEAMAVYLESGDSSTLFQIAKAQAYRFDPPAIAATYRLIEQHYAPYPHDQQWLTWTSLALRYAATNYILRGQFELADREIRKIQQLGPQGIKRREAIRDGICEFLAQRQAWTQVATLTTYFELPKHRRRWQCRAAQALARSGRFELAEQLLPDDPDWILRDWPGKDLDSYRNWIANWYRLTQLQLAISGYQRKPESETRRQISNGIQSLAGAQIHALDYRHITNRLLELGLHDQAVQFGKPNRSSNQQGSFGQVPVYRDEDQPLLTAIERLAKSNQFDEAIDVAQQLALPDWHLEGLGRVADAQIAAGQLIGASTTLDIALDFLQTHQGWSSQFPAVRKFVQRWLKVRSAEELVERWKTDLLEPAMDLGNLNASQRHAKLLGTLIFVLFSEQKLELGYQILGQHPESLSHEARESAIGKLCDAGAVEMALELLSDNDVNDKLREYLARALVLAGRPGPAMAIAKQVTPTKRWLTIRRIAYDADHSTRRALWDLVSNQIQEQPKNYLLWAELGQYRLAIQSLQNFKTTKHNGWRDVILIILRHQGPAEMIAQCLENISDDKELRKSVSLTATSLARDKDLRRITAMGERLDSMAPEIQIAYWGLAARDLLYRVYEQENGLGSW